MTDNKITLRLDIDWTPGTDGEGADWLVSALSDYFTREDYPLLEDYGTNAWGGYDGPKIVKVAVTTPDDNEED